MIQFPVVDDELVVGGIPLGSSPPRSGRRRFYAYDREAITRRVQLRETAPDGISLHYAIKANRCRRWSVISRRWSTAWMWHRSGDARGPDSGMPAGEISFAGPAKAILNCGAIAAGITLNLESSGELERAIRIGETIGVRPKVAVRVNPDFELKSSGMKMSGGPKPFGIDAELVPAVLRRIGESGAFPRLPYLQRIWANLRPDSLIEAQNATFELAYRLSDDAPAALEMLNIGGGFGIPYFPASSVSISHRSERPAALPGRMPCTPGRRRVKTELGRYLVAEASVYVCEVVDQEDVARPDLSGDQRRPAPSPSPHPATSARSSARTTRWCRTPR